MDPTAKKRVAWLNIYLLLSVSPLQAVRRHYAQSSQFVQAEVVTGSGQAVAESSPNMQEAIEEAIAEKAGLLEAHILESDTSYWTTRFDTEKVLELYDASKDLKRRGSLGMDELAVMSLRVSLWKVIANVSMIKGSLKMQPLMHWIQDKDDETVLRELPYMMLFPDHAQAVEQEVERAVQANTTAPSEAEVIAYAEEEHAEVESKFKKVDSEAAETITQLQHDGAGSSSALMQVTEPDHVTDFLETLGEKAGQVVDSVGAFALFLVGFIWALACNVGVYVVSLVIGLIMCLLVEVVIKKLPMMAINEFRRYKGWEPWPEPGGNVKKCLSHYTKGAKSVGGTFKRNGFCMRESVTGIKAEKN